MIVSCKSSTSPANSISSVSVKGVSCGVFFFFCYDCAKRPAEYAPVCNA